jgi:thiamine biosynthesis lipoprotein
MSAIASPCSRILVVLAGLLIGMPAQAEWFSRQEAIMGTVVRVELWHTDAAKADAAMAAVMAEMHRIDEAMSPYKEQSELSRINREAAKGPVVISQEMVDILTRSIEFSKLSDGAFDITFSSVGYLYDYRKHIKPSDAEVAKALPGINYRHLLLDPERRTIHYARDGVRIDLGGIAKGWAVDRCIAMLKSRGIHNAMVMAGGDTRLLGDRRGRPWNVGVRDPRQRNAVSIVLPLADTAISTSGDYERYFEEDGVRYHHIINPKTGKSATGVRSVTVIATDATTTEGLTKSVFVKGPEAGMQFLRTVPGVEGIVIDDHGRVLYSAGLQPGNQSPPAVEAAGRNSGH